MKIIVNGAEHTVQLFQIHYNRICAFAGIDPETKPVVTYAEGTVEYGKRGPVHEGIAYTVTA